MFILVISRGIPSNKHPQWGCFEQDQAEALASIGHKVVVASVDTRFLWEWRRLGITKTVTDSFVHYDSFIIPGAITKPLGQKLNLFIKQWQMDNIYRKIYNEHGEPDIIYGHFSFITSNAVKIAQKNNIPLVGMEHNAIFTEEKLSPHTEWSSKYVYQYTSQIISVSNHLKERIKYHLGKDSVVVHNTICKEFYYKEPIKHDTFTIVSIGSLIHRKGFDLLIEALSLSKSKLPPRWQLYIAGSGEYKESLLKQIENANLQENIYLIGDKNKRELAELLQQSDLFVLPSRSETFGVVYIEALACGVPIIATDCGVPKEIVTDKNGLFIPSENTTALANAIIQISSNLNLYNRQAIADDCKARFSPEVIAKKLTTIFEKVIKDYENHTTH